MKRLWMSGAAAVMAISIAGVGAQTPQQPPQSQPPATQPPTAQQPAAQAPEAANMVTKTIQGCVYKEEAVPGRTPNMAERAGVLEDYILVASDDTSAAGTAGTSGTTPPATTPPATTPPATTPPATTPRPSATGEATGSAGAHMTANKAFKLEKIDDERLQAVVGKRVEVTGRIDAEHGDMKHAGHPAATGTTGTAGAPARDRSLGPDRIELPEFEVTSIREVEGTCPATPNIRK